MSQTLCLALQCTNIHTLHVFIKQILAKSSSLTYRRVLEMQAPSYTWILTLHLFLTSLRVDLLWLSKRFLITLFWSLVKVMSLDVCSGTAFNPEGTSAQASRLSFCGSVLRTAMAQQLPHPLEAEAGLGRCLLLSLLKTLILRKPPKKALWEQAHQTE